MTQSISAQPKAAPNEGTRHQRLMDTVGEFSQGLQNTELEDIELNFKGA